jgi:hypothetical protein
VAPKNLRTIAGFALILASLPAANAQDLTFKTPAVKIPLELKDQRIMIVAFAQITRVSEERGVNVVRLDLTADLSDLQQNMTTLLSSELDTDDRCGDHIEIQHASLTPQDPAGLVVVQLHYERRACVKVLGKQQATKLVAGDAAIQIKLTPVVEDNNTKLRLMAEVGSIEADRSLGQLLRAGPLGEMLRDKIRNSVQSALQKGAELGATLPPSVQPYAMIQNARFRNAGAGRSEVVLTGEFRITNEQLQSLAGEVKTRTGVR